MLREQGISKTVANVELGVVTTNLHGDDTIEVCVVSILPGTYRIEFELEMALAVRSQELTAHAASPSCHPDHMEDALTITV